eukprot:CAMPEP_0118914464 /NCGR_PEP_ID=MMETSP1166-20130328/14832_1 /TAXON_ID=1104430 /ORGANISM="Chrysoreinhardia sp, Strain CCMP3193" /LENGTH=36 /DNA_ID= /DNA_START= /DNA_END= /DNA_ORIENTATION=
MSRSLLRLSSMYWSRSGSCVTAAIKISRSVLRLSSA